MSVYLAPADSRLAQAVATEGWLDDELHNQAMGYGLGEIGAQKAYEGFLEAFDSGTLFGVFRDGEPIGFAVVKKIPNSEVAQFHGFVARRFRRSILPKRALEAVAQATLGNGSFRLETEVLCRNERAVRLLKGVGFKPEGAHKARHLMDGKRETTVTLRLLKTEWRH